MHIHSLCFLLNVYPLGKICLPKSGLSLAHKAWPLRNKNADFLIKQTRTLWNLVLPMTMQPYCSAWKLWRIRSEETWSFPGHCEVWVPGGKEIPPCQPLLPHWLSWCNFESLSPALLPHQTVTESIDGLRCRFWLWKIHVCMSIYKHTHI